MNKSQIIFNLRMEMAAIRQALRDLENMEADPDDIDKLLDRLDLLMKIEEELKKE